jgi:hypothetical protein
MLVVLGVVLGGMFIRATGLWLETMEDVQVLVVLLLLLVLSV